MSHCPPRTSIRFQQIPPAQPHHLLGSRPRHRPRFQPGPSWHSSASTTFVSVFFLHFCCCSRDAVARRCGFYRGISLPLHCLNTLGLHRVRSSTRTCFESPFRCAACMESVLNAHVGQLVLFFSRMRHGSFHDSQQAVRAGQLGTRYL